ncbi:hypothetical protein [Devosia sp. Naph2]|uniref:hypothetical protein n=1 Tax=Devosia polycyclovorans TaxID=3345148 RepID=UPI0035CF6ECE
MLVMMIFTQADVDKLEFLRYAATFSGEQGLRAARELDQLERSLSRSELRDLDRHIAVCAQLHQGATSNEH